MKESTLLKIALIGAVIGILVLFFVTKTVRIDETTIDRLKTDETSSIKGTVTKITEKDNVAFVELTQENKISVILFKDYPIDLKEGEVVEVIGKTEEYEGKLEVVGKEVRVIE